MFWKNWSFAKKTLFSSLLTFTLFSLILYNALSTLEESNNAYSDIIAKEVKMSLKAKDLEALMLQSRRIEKDFLMRLDAKYIEASKSSTAELGRKAREISVMSQDLGYTEVTKLAKSVESDNIEYTAAFGKLADSWSVMGLDHNTGLQGKFRAASHDLEEMLVAYENTDLYLNLLHLRRWEKDYIRTLDEKYASRFDAYLATQFKLLETCHLSDPEKAKQDTALTEYASQWEVLKSSIRSGADDNISIAYDAMRAAIHICEEGIQENYIPDSKAQLLMVRRREKDYLLRHDDKYVIKTQQELSKLEDMITDSSVSLAGKKELLSKTYTYLNAFTGIVSEYNKTGKYAAAMLEAVRRTEEPIAKIESILDEKLESHSKQVFTEANAQRNFDIWATVIVLIGCMSLMLANVMGSAKMSSRISEVLDRLLQNSKRTSSSTAQIRNMSQSLADSSSEQASSLEECHASLEEILGKTRENTEMAEEANNLTSEARQVAESGSAEMEKMASAMNAIKSSSDNVAAIIKTIDEIAFQTNILALNAAVEAARAGETGAGFAVVADEVRSLAQRSALAARETTEKISDAIEKSEQGVRISGSVSESLEQIVVKVRSVDSLISGIAEASSRQNEGIKELNTAVSGMNATVQINAASSEESASSSADLESQTHSLVGLAQQLQSIIGSEAQSTPPEAAKAKKAAPAKNDFETANDDAFAPNRIDSAVASSGDDFWK